MGAQIAAHLANVGIPTLLLDIVPPGEEGRSNRNRLAAGAIDRLGKAKPSPFYLGGRAALITPGNLEDDLERLRDVDWVIEAVVENLAVKQDLLARVAGSVRPETVISTNTSGLPVNAVAAALPPETARYFLGTHFFNPPRYMRLLEIIPGQTTAPEVVDYMKDFGYRVLGKGVVVAKDTPNFIANRIGTYGMLDCLRATVEEGFTIEEVDALTGPILGRPKSASFRTLDMVGVDILWHVAKNTFDALPDGPEREAFRPAEILDRMVAGRRLGDKTGGGFYRKDKDGISVLDPVTLTYRPKEKVKLPVLEAARQLPDPAARVKALLHSRDRAGRLVWRLVRNVLLYSLEKWEELAFDIVSVDQAMRWGFNWSMGPFELWDAVGVEYTVKRLTDEGIAVPAALLRMRDGGVKSFYRTDGGTRYVYDPAAGESGILPTRPDFIFLPDLKAKTVFGNSGASLVDLGDGVACLEFHSKENAIGADIEQMIRRSVQEVEANFEALVLANYGRNFSVGANLVLILMEAEDDNWDVLDTAVRQFQNAGLALKYCLRPVVAAPFQMALGGGLEVCLASGRVQALAESYLGLVEVGVGLLPAGGGVKEMLFRAMEHVVPGVDPVPFVARAFETIASAKVSTSAPEAVQLGYLRPSDQVTVNPDRLVFDAKQTALGLARSGYRPPVPGTVRVTGTAGVAAVKTVLYGMREGRFISEHDFRVGSQVANVICGGPVTPGTVAGEQYILDLEREGFLSLLGEPKTQARIRHMLKTGKPLRN
jgi:3-hydroxyacyl-CoA dehydrogenase